MLLKNNLKPEQTDAAEGHTLQQNTLHHSNITGAYSFLLFACLDFIMTTFYFRCLLEFLWFILSSYFSISFCNIQWNIFSIGIRKMNSIFYLKQVFISSQSISPKGFSICLLKIRLGLAIILWIQLWLFFPLDYYTFLLKFIHSCVFLAEIIC